MRFQNNTRKTSQQRHGGRTVLVAAAALATFIVFGSKAAFLEAGERQNVKPEFTTFEPKDVPVDWGRISSSNIRLFYPGQSSWYWLTSPRKASRTRVPR
jgi:hypothetical protein